MESSSIPRESSSPPGEAAPGRAGRHRRCRWSCWLLAGFSQPVGLQGGMAPLQELQLSGGIPRGASNPCQGSSGGSACPACFSPGGSFSQALPEHGIFSEPPLFLQPWLGPEPVPALPVPPLPPHALLTHCSAPVRCCWLLIFWSCHVFFPRPLKVTKTKIFAGAYHLRGGISGSKQTECKVLCPRTASKSIIPALMESMEQPAHPHSQPGSDPLPSAVCKPD